jgi:16S rRNA (guanine527-N7)-methyltransferase
MSLDLSPGVLAGLHAQARLLAAWNVHINLTAIRDPVEVVRLHLLDSLAAVAPVRARLDEVRALVDIGSGAGYPGMPLGLALGCASIGLVESVGRKARFLEVAGAAVRAATVADRPVDVEVLQARAEELASGPRRANWDVATLRAVGSLAECAELGMPLLRPGGLLVCWKRDGSLRLEGGDGATVAPPGLRHEVTEARSLLDRLGGGAPEVIDAGVPGAPGHRLVLVRKERPTPAAYPRSPTVRRGRPGRHAMDGAGAKGRS